MCKGEYKDCVSHGKCDTCLLPTEEEKEIAIKSYLLFRNEAIKRIEQKQDIGNLKQFAFSREVFDVRLMKYKDKYETHFKGYTMRFIMSLENGKRLLIYEKDGY